MSWHQQISWQYTVWLLLFSPCSNFTDTFQEIAEVQSTYLSKNKKKENKKNTQTSHDKSKSCSQTIQGQTVIRNGTQLMGFLFLGLVIMKSSDKNWWFTDTVEAWLSPLYVSSACFPMWWHFCYFLIVSPLHLSFYPLTCCFILILPSCSLA